MIANRKSNNQESISNYNSLNDANGDVGSSENIFTENIFTVHSPVAQVPTTDTNKTNQLLEKSGNLENTSLYLSCPEDNSSLYFSSFICSF